MRAPQLIGLLVLSLIWGASFMFIKVMLEEIGPVAVAWLRLGGGSLLLLIVAAPRLRSLSVKRLGDLLVLGAFSSAIPFMLIPWGEERIDSSLAAILNAAMPLFVVPLAHIALVDEPMTRLRTAGIALGFAGVVVVIGPDLLDIAKSSTQGQLAVVLASASYAAGAVWTRRRMLGIDPIVLSAGQGVAAFVLVTPLLFTFEFAPPLVDLSSRVQLATLGLALLSSGVAVPIYFWLVATVSATHAALVTYLAPVAALFWGWLVLSEGIAIAAVPGLALIIAGVYLVTRAPAEGAAAPAPPARLEA
ncbi:MAG TPA: DMT family transporter [Dehalococcoidia bacterium]|nr:DMT family transporter [Dehalococcoidia bacterium]